MSDHTTWEVDPDGVAEVCDSDDMTAGLEQIAKDLADRLNATAPRKGPFRGLKGSWSASGREVATSSPFWHLAEYGTRSQPPLGLIRNAMDAVGFTTVEDGS